MTSVHNKCIQSSIITYNTYFALNKRVQRAARQAHNRHKMCPPPMFGMKVWNCELSKLLMYALAGPQTLVGHWQLYSRRVEYLPLKTINTYTILYNT